MLKAHAQHAAEQQHRCVAKRGISLSASALNPSIYVRMIRVL